MKLNLITIESSTLVMALLPKKLYNLTFSELVAKYVLKKNESLNKKISESFNHLKSFDILISEA